MDADRPREGRGATAADVGGGASAVQLLGEIAPVAADTLWVTRREPVWRSDDFTPEVGRAAVALVEERVRRGLPPAGEIADTLRPGVFLMRRPRRHAARVAGAVRHPVGAEHQRDGALEHEQPRVERVGVRRAVDVGVD